MDYGRLNRRELQSLCKEHGIPANKTNVFMAEALNALLNAPKDKAMDSGPDPAEVVKGRATRSRQAVSPAEDVVSPTELDDLSIHLAQNTLKESCGSDSTTADEEDSWKEVQLEARLPLGKSLAEMEEPVKVYQSRRARKAVDVEVRSKAKHEIVMLMEVTQAAPSPVAAPALVNDDVQPAVDTSPDVVDSIVESNGPTTKVAAKNTKSKGKKSAKAKAQEVPDIPVEAISPPIDGDLKNEDQDAAIPSSEEKSEVDPPVPSAPAVVAKKSKANGTRSKKTRSAAAPAPTLKDEATHGAEEQSKGPFKVSDSPAYGLTVEGNCDLAQEKLAADFSTQVGGSRSSSPVDESFEFQPVPASFEEIMSSDLPQGTPVPAPGCCHRVGKKPGMGGCPSCASERKVAELMQGMLNSMDEKSALTEEKEHAHASAKNYANTTPTKPHDDKENVLKSEDVEAIPLEKMSMRKLQKKLQKKSLSKRNNMAAPAIV